MKDQIHQYLLLLGDNPLILGHRLSELCGHGPNLETDIALTNISLDLFGQVRHYFQYAVKLQGENKTEDDIAFLRYPHEYKNVLLTEQPNTDFAYVIARQFFFDAYHLPLLEQLMASRDKQIAAIAAKSIKEVKYHLRFSSEWVKRLGDGTGESRQRMQNAVDELWPYTNELFEVTPLEATMQEAGIGADLSLIKTSYIPLVTHVLQEATLAIPEVQFSHSGGKEGVHTEQMGYILAELQYMQRAYPNMSW
ncbi:MAG: 1,2-phenylacetyl-CoA epoxidase subunit PaaC [Saprospiraceae bacterium]|nr:phenylacetate-CoA oxygenase subunit PaaC [Lewinella sp.]